MPEPQALPGKEEVPNWINLEELEAIARPKTSAMVDGFYSSGAETQSTLRDNRAAYHRYRLVPRCMVNVQDVDMRFTLLGQELSCPILIAPMAQQCLAHPSGEIATVSAAAACGMGMIQSANGNISLERVAEAGYGKGVPLLMFQLYVFRDRAFTKKVIKKAAAAGYTALVVTVDSPRLGTREADERNKFQIPEGLSLPNLDGLGQVDDATRREVASQNILQLNATQVDSSLTWEFVAWARQHWEGPIFVKGILGAYDAIRALEAKVDGLILSNHGGRQMDYAPSALDMVETVRRSVGRRVPILIDGGVRRGTDVLKALALGADAVLLGRPVLHGLAVDGQAGVEKVLNTLKNELKLNMGLAGRPTLLHITRDLVLGPHEVSRL